MRYARILSAVAGTPWAIHPAKGQAVLEFLAFAASGGKRSPAEIMTIVAPSDAHPHPARGNATALIRADDDEVLYRHSDRMNAAEQQAIADRGGIAVVGLKGVISPRLSDEMDVSGPGGTSAEGFAKRFQAALADPRVGGVIIDVDSPGGAVFGVPEAAEAVLAARGGDKPVVAVASPWAASAAYWIASAASELVVAPSGEVGSIGVYSWHEDLSKALADAGVAITLIRSDTSPHKAETHQAFPLAPEARDHLQASVDRYGRQFVDAVARARGVKASDVVARFGGGRMVPAADAVAAGMADRTGTLDGEIARMSKALAKPASGKRAAASARRRAALW
jgi:capsid assembly protease